MVRQDEQPWQGRVTGGTLGRGTGGRLPSSCRSPRQPASCEHRAAQDLVRVVSSDGTDTGYAATARHTDSIMEHLARVGPLARGIRPPTARAARGARPGWGPVVVGAIDDTGAGLASIHALIRLKPRFGRVVVVGSTGRPGIAAEPSAGTPRRRVGDPGTALPLAWQEIVRPERVATPGVAAR